VKLVKLGVLALAVVTIGAVIPPHGFNLSYMDRTCAACQDFYQFAVGKYAAAHPIPPDKSGVGSFEEVRERNLAQLHAILDASADPAGPPATGIAKQVGDFYAACMDTATIEAAGLKPLERPLGIVDAITSKADLPAALAQLQLLGFAPYFNYGSEQDDKDASSQIFALEQGGLGMPERDYYFKNDAATKAVRDAYVAHIAKLFALTGSDPATAAAAAKSVMTTETALAQTSSTQVELRDPVANYHVVPAAKLASDTAFAWPAFMSQLGVPAVSSVVVRQPKFIASLDGLLERTSLDDIKTYLRWNVIEANGLVLPKAIDDEDFAYSSKLNGQKQLEDRWKRCANLTDGALGEALGQLYVAKAFSPEARARAVALVNNIQAVLRSDISTLAWMSPATRRRAVEKLDAYTKKVGYPDKWLVYTYDIARSTAYANLLASNDFQNKRWIAKIGKPVDRSEWYDTPPTVNAYYDTSNNEIAFPAGILQAPFYDPGADDAYNYGAIGVVIGHEMTHGFDDDGHLYDAKGNLDNWWTPQDKKNFDKRASCVAAYQSTLVVEKGVKENGNLVEGESIADLGGTTIAYKALQRALAGKPRTVVDGFTPDQRFFLGFAQIWASNERPESARTAVNVDPHPFNKNRVNGTVANMPEFAAAWHCPLKSAMVRPAAVRCKIW
jgi:predicted metalloendopeptidase